MAAGPSQGTISPPLSTTSSTDFEQIHGPLTLAQFVSEIEALTGTNVVTLTTGPRALLIYLRNAQQPVVDTTLIVNVAVNERYAHAIRDAEIKSAQNLQDGRNKVSPKKPEFGPNNSIYFAAVCEDNETYTISWAPRAPGQ